MANSSSFTSAKETHDVFISFRGDDTRKTFTSNLNSAFKRLDINTYIDDKLERGDEISQSLLRAIEEAKLSVIVFSKNFATSKWCLDEVMKILDCRKYKGQMILPVFYDADPSHVRHQLASYADAFAKHEQRYGSNMNIVQKWRDALTEAANHSGWDCCVNRTESELVEEIAMDVLRKLNHVYVGDLDQQISKLEQLAQLQHEYYKSINSYDNLKSYQATVERVTELKMKRNVRLLRLTPDMLSHLEGSDTYDNYI